MNAPGVLNVGLLDIIGNPLVPVTGDFVLAPTEVATFLDGLTWLAV